jgi:hypothetical protein
MIPPEVSAPDVVAHYQRLGDALAAAIEKSGVKYAVVLSSVGADKPDTNTPGGRAVQILKRNLGRFLD